MDFDQSFQKLLSNKELVEKNVAAIHDEVFEHTDCLACGNCCKSAPPIVTKKDIKRIAKKLEMTPKSFERQYVIDDVDGTKSFHRVPCPFLEEETNICKIYEDRPFACRDYPHTNSQFFKRKNLHRENIQICPAVEEIFIKLENLINQNNL